MAFKDLGVEPWLLADVFAHFCVCARFGVVVQLHLNSSKDVWVWSTGNECAGIITTAALDALSTRLEEANVAVKIAHAQNVPALP